MIIFEKIRFKNFLSYGNTWTEIELNKAQDTLIVGENGAGKSTFLDALSYALYMKPFRKVNNPQLVNSINKKHLAVEVEFRVGSNSYKVCRGHAPRYFEVHQNGQMLNQDSHTKDYQKILEQNILKMNYKSFTQIVVLGSRNFVPFMQLSTSDRRSVIEDLLDIQIFSTMATLLKDKVSENKTSLQKMDYDINLIEEKIIMEQQYLEQMKEDKGAERTKLENTVQSKQLDLEHLQSAVESLEAQVKQLLSGIDDVEKLQTKSDKYRQLKSAIKTKLDSIAKKKNFFLEHEHCPTCEQDIDDSIKETKIKNAEEVHETTTSGLTELESQLEDITATLVSYRGIQGEISELQTDINTNLNKQAGISSFIQEVRTHINELDDKTTVATTDDDKATLEQDLAAGKQTRADARQKQVVLNTATTLLRDTGIKARIIKQYVPVMNKLINKYLAAMEFFVDFNLDEDFKETIRSRHRDDFAYASFSEGEKMRIDLALLFTWRAIAKLKNSASTNLLIMDEVFDSSLDASGTDEFLKIIKELTSDTNIIIISHKTDQLLDKFTNILRFEKHKNFSRIA
jgi:DNA repair exonuclease SbcCD ATPase subunit|tara:strand:- start:4081 stop:5790 length:1710 start_codon:yes stop_codon:yes gene_type:complete